MVGLMLQNGIFQLSGLSITQLWKIWTASAHMCQKSNIFRCGNRFFSMWKSLKFYTWSWKPHLLTRDIFLKKSHENTQKKKTITFTIQNIINVKTHFLSMLGLDLEAMISFYCSTHHCCVCFELYISATGGGN